MNELTREQFEQKVKEAQTYEKLHAWLFKHADTVFTANQYDLCPLAKYFREATGIRCGVNYDTVVTDEFPYWTEGLTPLFARLVRSIDYSTGEATAPINGSECLALLELVKSEDVA